MAEIGQAEAQMNDGEAYDAAQGSWSARSGRYRVSCSIHDERVRVPVGRMSHRADDSG